MRQAIIIGAGPAGLTAAYELLKRTNIVPIILEKSSDIGGISKTINYKGNRMDMGPHRFFSKSDRVMNWWLSIMPLENDDSNIFTISYHNKTRNVESSASIQHAEKRMLVIQRLTRIYFLKKFFSYPLQLSLGTLHALGIIRTIQILTSFLWVHLFPRKQEKSLEDFIINKFGRQLYLLFFKDYTEKVWGVPCKDISSEWGAQRIKGISLGKAISEAIKNINKRKSTGVDVRQKGKETSLIEQFLYPKYGPGSLWEEVARQVQEMGGKIYLQEDVIKIHQQGEVIISIDTVNSTSGKVNSWKGDYFFSSMPVQELIACMDSPVPANVQEVAAGLQYRDFINVGVLLKNLSMPGRHPGEYQKLDLKDNWIYIQERDVNVGRLMIYNNWGDGMVKDLDTMWIGMEYFCNKTDNVWSQDDAAIKKLAITELEQMGLAKVEDVLDTTVHRMEKTYPAYFGTYNRFSEIRQYVDRYKNLFPVGRNGMHKYNNADHSMLTAMVSVDNIIAGVTEKESIWSINTENEYHEIKQQTSPGKPQIAFPGKTKELTFPGFIWGNRRKRAFLLSAIGLLIIEFILFKLKYPYANYMPDSYSYLEAAYTNADVNMWPVAYSKFLRLLSVFLHSDKLVALIQYLILQGSLLSFLFTLFFFFKPGKKIQTLLSIIILFNPIPLYIGNYISADALFISLSILWFTSLLWILHRPKTWQLTVHALILLACFTVRYNAIYYPLITTIAILLSRYHWKWKLSGIALSYAFIGFSILYTSGKMQEISGKSQFSPFGGWQLANNALYMYQHISPGERHLVPEKFARLEEVVRQHMDTLKRVKFTAEDSANNYFYLWSNRSPLIYYMDQEWKGNNTISYFKKWASEGPLYASYALYLIKTYPGTFLMRFIMSNFSKYATPPLEFLGVYNMGSDSVNNLAKQWFNYKSLRISNQKKDSAIRLLLPYPTLVALANLCFLMGLIGITMFGEFKKFDKLLGKALLLTTVLWLFNGAFSLFASPIVLRYQIFPVIVYGIFSILILERFIIQKKEG